MFDKQKKLVAEHKEEFVIGAEAAFAMFGITELVIRPLLGRKVDTQDAVKEVSEMVTEYLPVPENLQKYVNFMWEETDCTGTTKVLTTMPLRADDLGDFAAQIQKLFKDDLVCLTIETGGPV